MKLGRGGLLDAHFINRHSVRLCGDNTSLTYKIFLLNIGICLKLVVFSYNGPKERYFALYLKTKFTQTHEILIKERRDIQ